VIDKDHASCLLAREVNAEAFVMATDAEAVYLGFDTPEQRRVIAAHPDVLLAEHKSYLPALRPVLDRVHAMSHITGGGLPENLDRALPPTLDAVIELASWRVPSVFGVLMEAGNVERAEMFRAFNMGVGMVIICAPSDAEAVLSAASAAGLAGWKIGSLKPGSGAVKLS
jgi:phosphoribosylformylglycinamidine cyclo-ligase